jgi:hypothetical protein
MEGNALERGVNARIKCNTKMQFGIVLWTAILTCLVLYSMTIRRCLIKIV